MPQTKNLKKNLNFKSSFPLVGVLGAGQLGRMLALAGYPLGIQFRFLDLAPYSPAGQVAQAITGDFRDEATLQSFIEGVDVVTYEFENAPLETAEWIASRIPVFPTPIALKTAQDRLNEKNLFKKLGIETPCFARVSSLNELHVACAEIGFPAVLKTRRLGYDGKGQWILNSLDESIKIWEEIEKDRIGEPISLILEGYIRFDREISLIAARSRTGDTVYYPLFENQHQGGILRITKSPAPDISLRLAKQATHAMASLLDALDYVGVLTIEFFVYEDRLIANEIAPRVHNSGHGTIEGNECSQFENHLRAILGFPLGDVAPRGTSIMWNLLGEAPLIQDILSIPRTYLHLYGKEERTGRKIGHVTLLGESATELNDRFESVKKMAPQK